MTKPSRPRPNRERQTTLHSPASRLPHPPAVAGAPQAQAPHTRQTGGSAQAPRRPIRYRSVRVFRAVPPCPSPSL
eukprot:4996362-Prymnesium_polylepis.1